MIELLIKIVINAVALIVAARLVPKPGIELPIPSNFDKPEQWVGILAIALIFAIVNTYIMPIVKALTLPVRILTVGLASFVINAAMLLGVAWLVTEPLKDTLHVTFRVGGFPPDFGYEAIGAAVVGSIIISIVSTILSVALAPRKAFRL